MLRPRQIAAILAVFAVAGVLGGGFAAQEGDSASPHMQLNSESVVGVVLYPDGETPVPDLSVHVWCVDKQRFVFRTRTDENGNFEIPWMREGRAFILVGDIKVDLQVLAMVAGSAGQRHDLVVVIPRRMMIGSAGPRLMHVIPAQLLMTTPLLPALISP